MHLYFLLLLLLGGVLADTLFIDDDSQFFAGNITHTAADQIEVTRWMNLCAADPRCARFAGLTLGGTNAVQTFNALLTLVPFTQLPPLLNNGLYDNLIGRNVSEANDRLMVLSMVYEFSYFASSCAATEIPLLLGGAITCQTNQRLSGVPPSNNSGVMLFLLCAITVLLLFVLIGGCIDMRNESNGIRRNTTQ